MNNATYQLSATFFMYIIMYIYIIIFFYFSSIPTSNLRLI